MDPDQRKERLDIFGKLKEREGLLQLEANLKLQLELIQNGATQQQQSYSNSNQYNPANRRQQPPFNDNNGRGGSGGILQNQNSQL